MKKSLLALLIAGFSTNVFAQEIKVLNADGWQTVVARENELVSRFFPGALIVLSKSNAEAGATDGTEEKPPTTVTLRKVKADKLNLLKDKKDDWQRALWTPEQIRKAGFINQRPIQIDGKWRYIAELTRDVGTKTMANIAVAAFVVDEELYVMKFEQNNAFYKAGIKQALDLFKTVNLEVVRAEAAVK